MLKKSNPLIVKYKDYSWKAEEGPLVLENGAVFHSLNIRYESYGQLNEAKSNAILILHAFSGDAHAAGLHSYDDKYPGWWDSMIGPGKPFDTDKYFIICSNCLGGCQGTTGPSSLNPETGKAYGLDFPAITIGDMVKVQKLLIDHLGIDTLLAVAGGSMGGMQALEWAAAYPEAVASAIVLASTARLTAQAIAFHAVGRNAILSDPNWKQGQYADSEVPGRGLAIARMIGHITYLSDESMRNKFGRRVRGSGKIGIRNDIQFEVESYLEYKGTSFVDRFDAKSYIYLSKAMDYFNLEEKYGSLEKAFEKTNAKFLIVSYSSDWLFPTYQSKEIVVSLMHTDKDVSFTEIAAPYGHDSFLLESRRQAPLIRDFLANVPQPGAQND